MNYTTDHVGYLTGDISSTAKEFERLGYVAGEIVDDLRFAMDCSNGLIRCIWSDDVWLIEDKEGVGVFRFVE